jgi:hypothetical protein
MKRMLLLLFLSCVSISNAQSWPSVGWSSAANLTATMDADGITDLSGLHFNPVNNRLYCVQGDGRVRVLQWNTTTNSFSQLASKSISGGPEGITQANLYANEFYTIDENNYQIRRYTHTADFSTVSLFKHWNLLASPSPMQDTGNTGPEGIAFVPDSALLAIGFISQQTGQPYTSVKGLGGLFFVAHQDGGYIWVFDVNPNANDDFVYVGKYKTNRSESCDLSFDRSTGLLYILHNITGENKLEVTNLSTAITSGERKFTDTAEYNLAFPGDGNDNVEGFAVTSKCTTNGNPSAWLCRDVESNEDVSIQQDALRWFTPFAVAGECLPLAQADFNIMNLSISPNPAHNNIVLSGKIANASLRVINNLGQVVLEKENVNNGFPIDISALPNGNYILEAHFDGTVSTVKWIKN